MDPLGYTQRRLTQRHDVHIVVYNHVHAWEPLLHSVDDGIAVPSRHNRRRHHGPYGEIYWPGHAHANPYQRDALKLILLEKSFNQRACPAQADDGSIPNGASFLMVHLDAS